MVELGSFWAYYSVWARHGSPAPQVLVEPDPSNLALGDTTSSSTGSTGDLSRPRSTRTGRSDLRLGKRRLAHDVAVSFDGLADRAVERIDLLLPTSRAPSPLRSAAPPALWRRPGPLPGCFTHHHTISGDPLTHQHCLRILRDAGAHLVVEHSVSESCSGDGLIVASMFPERRICVRR